MILTFCTECSEKAKMLFDGCLGDVAALRERAEKAEQALAKLALLEKHFGDSVAVLLAKARARDLLDVLGRLPDEADVEDPEPIL